MDQKNKNIILYKIFYLRIIARHQNLGGWSYEFLGNIYL